MYYSVLFSLEHFSLFPISTVYHSSVSILLTANLLEHLLICTRGRTIIRIGIYYLTSTELISLTLHGSCEVCVGD